MIGYATVQKMQIAAFSRLLIQERMELKMHYRRTYDKTPFPAKLMRDSREQTGGS